MGETEFFSGREGRALSSSQRHQMRKATGPEPQFDAQNMQQLTYMQRKYEMARQEQAEKTGGKQVNLRDNCVFRCMPSEGKREVVMIVGQQGAGKSWWCGRYARLWLERQMDLFTRGQRIPSIKNIRPRVFVLSAKREDPDLDKVGVTRILIDKSIEEADLDVQKFSGHLVIFDDHDYIVDKKHKKIVQALLDQICGVGRSDHVWCLRTSHMFFNWNATRVSLMEANKVVFFPKRGGSRQGVEWLRKNAHCDPKYMKKILSSDSRWLVYDLTAPNYVLTETELYIVQGR